MRNTSREITTARGVTFRVNGIAMGAHVRTSVEQLKSEFGGRREWKWVYGIPAACKQAEAEIRAELAS